MFSPDSENPLFDLAMRFVNETGRHLFLTGRAGTGKTTFLRHVKETTSKKIVIIAPTGVAAINAGGVTMHSFFQLPFGPYIPQSGSGWNPMDEKGTDQSSLLKNLRMNSEKRKLLQELELLVIDEVSMLRADMLDAIDLILRHFRKQHFIPYGGVQVLFIGDLFQLPPVVKNEEWSILSRHYRTPFFFDARVIRESPPLYFELSKIYRQTDNKFIEVLNNIRNNTATSSDFLTLNKRYDPEFESPAGDHYITLTTHNSKADAINSKALEGLPGNVYSFEGEVKGDFNDKSLPVEKIIQVKKGAQIMFIKNDKGELRRYYNGKIGSVSQVGPNRIKVRFSDQEEEIEVEKETWKNIRYYLGKDNKQIEEEELGTFTQYPIRLAWAITIHKSQGLTFEKAIVDAGSSFAAGQVYVALSRLTSLEGLVLGSKIPESAVNTDQRVIDFTKTAQSEDVLQKLLDQERVHYLGELIVRCFYFSKLQTAIAELKTALGEWTDDEQSELEEWCMHLEERVEEMRVIGGKFQRQMKILLQDLSSDGLLRIEDRTKAAKEYFNKWATEELSELKDYIKEYRNTRKVRLFVNLLQSIFFEIAGMSSEFVKGEALAKAIRTKQNIETVIGEFTSATVNAVKLADDRKKPEKGFSRKETLRMFKEGKSIEEISEQRSMAISTIAGHLNSFIPTNEISLTELMSAEKVQKIQAILASREFRGLGEVKREVGEEFSYAELMAVYKAEELRRVTDEKVKA